MTLAEPIFNAVIRPRWHALAKQIMPYRLTRIIAPSGFHKTLFSNFLLETIPAAKTHRIDFADSMRRIPATLGGVAQAITDELGLDPLHHATPHLLARSPTPKPRQFAEAFKKDFAHPALDKHVLILEGLQDLDTSIMSVLLHACRATPMRVRIIVCLRTEHEFPIDGMTGAPILDITADDLALTNDEMSALKVHEPTLRGWPHGVFITLQGGSIQQELQDMVRLLDRDLRHQLYAASILDVWPPSPEIASALNLPSTFLNDVRREGLVLTRATGLQGQATTYDLLPALRVIVQEEAERECPGLLNESRRQLAQVLNTYDPVRSVRLLSTTGDQEQMVALVNDAISAGDISLLEHVQDDLLKASVHLNKRVRLELALLLARSGKMEAGLRLLHRLLPEVQAASQEREIHRRPIDPDDVTSSKVHLALARVLMLTGAASTALVELKKAAVDNEDPYIQGYTALIICMMHARGVREQQTGNYPLQEAESYISYITRLTLDEGLQKGFDKERDDVRVMGLACELYFALYYRRPFGPLLSRLSFMVAQSKFREIEGGLALLFIARILTDMGYQDVAQRCIMAAQPLVASTPDGQVLLPFISGRRALRMGRANIALGYFEEAVSAANHPAVDQEIRAEALESRLCAALCCTGMERPSLQEMQEMAKPLIQIATRAEHRTIVRTGLTFALEYEERDDHTPTARSKVSLARLIKNILTEESLRRSEVYVLLLLRLISIRGRAEERARRQDVIDARLHFGEGVVDGYQSLLIPHLQASSIYNVSVTLFGTAQVEIDGSVLPLRSANLQIFAAIALAGVDGISRDQLVNDLYEGDQVRGHRALTRFRDFLSEHGPGPEVCGLTSARGTYYTLAHNRVEIDVLQLQQLLQEKSVQAQRQFRQTAPFLAGVQSPWVNRMRKELQGHFA